jgi:hypothetical protein
MHVLAPLHSAPLEQRAEQIPVAPCAFPLNCRQTPLAHDRDSTQGSPSATDPASLAPPSAPPSSAEVVPAVLVPVVALEPQAGVSHANMAATQNLVRRPEFIASSVPQDVSGETPRRQRVSRLETPG